VTVFLARVADRSPRGGGLGGTERFPFARGRGFPAAPREDNVEIV
jgi:hypothetical protein